MSINTPWAYNEQPSIYWDAENQIDYQPWSVPDEIEQQQRRDTIQDWISIASFAIHMNDNSIENFNDIKETVLPWSLRELFGGHEIIEDTYVIYANDKRLWKMELRIDGATPESIWTQLIQWLLQWYREWNYNPEKDNWEFVSEIEDFYWVSWDLIKEM